MRFSPFTALRYALILLPLDVLWPSLLKMEGVRPK
jgi:hypothetical protein